MALELLPHRVRAPERVTPADRRRGRRAGSRALHAALAHDFGLHQRVGVGEHLTGLVFVAESAGKVGKGLGGDGHPKIRAAALVHELNGRLVEDLGSFVDEEIDRRQRINPVVVAVARHGGEIGQQDGADGAAHRRVGQRIQTDIDHLVAVNDLRHVGHQPLVAGLEVR